ncbi:paraquat-inducible protein B, partial [Serratia sp. SRS-8-S-2018]
KPWKGPRELFGYPLMPTTSGGLAQIQQKLMQTLDKINSMPINPMINEATKTLAESQKTMKSTQQTMKSLNDIIASKEMQALPQDMQKTLLELNRSMKGFQPGSPAYNKMVGDMQRLDQVLRELQPVLRTLNEKSNALVFEAAGSTDPQPKKATK